jgi:hypothetical protein
MINNPWGVMIAAVTLVIALYKSLNKQMTIAEQKKRALNDVDLTAQNNIIRETQLLDRLFRVAGDETRSKEDRLMDSYERTDVRTWKMKPPCWIMRM